jgi:hypothetical protein
MILTKNQKKQALYFINSHRDGCQGNMLLNHVDGIYSENQLLSLLKNLHEEKLIDFNNELNGEFYSEKEMINSFIVITGGYTDPNYCNIY